jgi:hypothetical protein
MRYAPQRTRCALQAGYSLLTGVDIYTQHPNGFLFDGLLSYDSVCRSCISRSIGDADVLVHVPCGCCV